MISDSTGAEVGFVALRNRSLNSRTIIWTDRLFVSSRIGRPPIQVLADLDIRRPTRNLDKHALAFVGAALANLPHGTNQHHKKQEKSLDFSCLSDSEHGSDSTKREIADRLGISESSITRAKAVLSHCTPDVIAFARDARGISLTDWSK